MASLKEEVFTLQYPTLGGRALAVLLSSTGGNKDREVALDALHPMLTVLWGMTVAAVLHGLWCWRVKLLYGEATTEQVQRALVIARVTSKLMLLRHVHRCSTDTAVRAEEIRLLWRLQETLTIWEIPLVMPVPTGTAQYVLFFDGGSRGNPGPGGSGSVIVRVNAELRHATIVWFACMAYGAAGTTNNVAEYHGVEQGLRHALAI